MPRPSVEIETIDELNEVVRRTASVPPRELDFEAKLMVLLEKVDEQQDRIDSLEEKWKSLHGSI